MTMNIWVDSRKTSLSGLKDLECALFEHHGVYDVVVVPRRDARGEVMHHRIPGACRCPRDRDAACRFTEQSAGAHCEFLGSIRERVAAEVGLSPTHIVPLETDIDDPLEVMDPETLLADFARMSDAEVVALLKRTQVVAGRQ